MWLVGGGGQGCWNSWQGIWNHLPWPETKGKAGARNRVHDEAGESLGSAARPGAQAEKHQEGATVWRGQSYTAQFSEGLSDGRLIFPGNSAETQSLRTLRLTEWNLHLDKLPSRPQVLYCYQVQAHNARHTTGQSIERQGAGARNSDFIQKTSRLRDVGLMSQRTIFPELEFRLLLH